MSTNPHREAPIAWFGASPKTARLGVLLLHGRTQSPAIMDDFLVKRLSLDDVCYAAPWAADSAWYPGSFLAPFSENEPKLSQALDCLAAATNELENAGFPRASQAVLGFSQGACLACEYIYRTGARVGALLALTGGLLGPKDTTTWDRKTDAFKDMPILLGGSTEDPWVPAFRMKETAAVFGSLGARVETTLYESNVHEICDDQIEVARALLQSLR